MVEEIMTANLIPAQGSLAYEFGQQTQLTFCCKSVCYSLFLTPDARTSKIQNMNSYFHDIINIS